MGLDWHVDNGKFGATTNGGEPQRKSGPIELAGNGDFDECSKIAKIVIVRAPCTLEPCSLLGIYQPSLEGVTFWLQGEYANIWRLLMTREEFTSQPLLALQRHGRRFCKLPYN